MNAFGHLQEESCERAYSMAVGEGIDEDLPRQSGFDPLEWLIISIGQRDGPSGVSQTRFDEAIGRLFGMNGPQDLANPRLEQLRRMAASASGRGWHAPASEMAAFIRAGWTGDQLELLVAAVAPAACARRAAVRPL